MPEEADVVMWDSQQRPNHGKIQTAATEDRFSKGPTEEEDTTQNTNM